MATPSNERQAQAQQKRAGDMVNHADDRERQGGATMNNMKMADEADHPTHSHFKSATACALPDSSPDNSVLPPLSATLPPPAAVYCGFSLLSLVRVVASLLLIGCCVSAVLYFSELRSLFVSTLTYVRNLGPVTGSLVLCAANIVGALLFMPCIPFTLGAGQKGKNNRSAIREWTRQAMHIQWWRSFLTVPDESRARAGIACLVA